MIASLLDFTSENNSGGTPMSPLVRGPATTNKARVSQERVSLYDDTR